MTKTNQSTSPLSPERATQQRKLIIRLRRVEGQLRGIQAMMEKGDSCESIAQQLSAARRALDKTFHEMVACHLQMEIAASQAPEQVLAATEHMTRLLSKYG